MNNKAALLILLTSITLSVGVGIVNHPLIVIAYAEVLFVGIAIVPGFKGMENKIMFALLTFSSIPANVGIIVNSKALAFMTDSGPMMTAACGVLLYALLFIFEQISAAVIVRLIWPDQLPTGEIDEDEEQEDG